MYATQVQQKAARGLSLGGRIIRRGDTGYGNSTMRPGFSLGEGVSGAGCGSVNSTQCTTYPDPETSGCPTFNGCGDTIGISALVGASVQGFLIQIQAPWAFTPRLFLYTGPAATFTIASIRVANGGNSHFGPPYAADVHGLAAFTRKEVSWPTFRNSPPLELLVNNLTAAPATFAGLLVGVSLHA